MLSKEFFTAGHAIFTVSNPTGEHYTYRITTPRDQNEMKPIWFVACLTGPDNLRDYSYLGLLHENGEVAWTNKSKFTKESKAFQVVKWAVKKAFNGEELPTGYKLDHEGYCAVCGRTLTTPESLESGIGPVCRERI